MLKNIYLCANRTMSACNTWNHLTMQIELLVLESNTWSYLSVYK